MHLWCGTILERRSTPEFHNNYSIVRSHHDDEDSQIERDPPSPMLVTFDPWPNIKDNAYFHASPFSTVQVFQ